MKARAWPTAVLFAIAFACGGKEEAVEKCGPDCSLECDGALPEGLIGSHLGAVSAADGRLFVSAYVDHAREGKADIPYGDLVFGAFDVANASFAWQVVAGVGESTGCPAKPSKTFRGGRTEVGDDVGLYSQIVLLPGDEPLLTYFDVTHHSLRAARRESGVFASHPIAQSAVVDAGRYARTVVWRERPAVAYVAVSQEGGSRASRVLVSEATSDRPTDTGDWKTTEVSKGKVVGSPNTDPTAPEVSYGAGLGMAARGDCLAVALYDPQTAKLSVFRRAGDTWTPAESTAALGSAYGQTAGGITAIALDDACTAHVAYRVATASPLLYRQCDAAGMFTPEEIIDDGGTTVDGRRQGDGAHLLADAAILIRGEQVLVAYQDATAGRLRVAARKAAGWTVHEAASVNERAEGAFPAFTSAGVVSFSRLRVSGVAQGSVSQRSFGSLGL